MTPQQLIAIAIRLFAIWLIILSFRYLSSVPAYFAYKGEIAERIYQAYIMAAAYIIPAIFLWLFPMTTAKKIIPALDQNTVLEFKAIDLARVGCALIGLWLFAKSSTGLFGNIISMFIENASLQDFEPPMKVEFGVLVFEFVLAVLLIIKSRNFSNVIFQSK